MKILIIDNYDSFTYNLVQLVEDITGERPEVFRNDKISLDEVEAYDTIILSPGPGLPKDAGIMPELIQRFKESKAILGICLGHQAIGEAFGADLQNLSKVYHGFQTPIFISEGESKNVYEGLGQEISVARYHSWIIKNGSCPPELIVTAKDAKGEIMSVQHKDHRIVGLQYHPESILTPDGHQLLRNFLNANRA